MKVSKRFAILATCSALVVSVPLYAQFGGIGAFKRVIDAATGQAPSTPATPSNSPGPSSPPVQDNASAMIARWSDLHNACRSGAGRRDADGYPIACNDRDALTETLEQNGWCMGGGDPNWSGDDEWRRCSVAAVPTTPRDILKGQWVPTSDSCTPKDMISDNFIEIGIDEEGDYPFPRSEYLRGASHGCTFPRRGIADTSSYVGPLDCGYGEGWEGRPQVNLSVTAEGLLEFSYPSFTISDGSDRQRMDPLNDTYKRCPNRLEWSGEFGG